MNINFKRVFIGYLIICITFTLTFAQRQKRSASILLEKNKPAVYISFLNLREIKPDDPSDDEKNLFFEIKNNTKWNIWLQMSGVSKEEHGDASLYYAIKDENGIIKFGSTQCHVCSVNPIRSGRSIIFSIPISQANIKDYMELEYSFEWERDYGFTNGSNTNHTVSYEFYYLPKAIEISGREKDSDLRSNQE